jgi:hypothetical protein
MIVVSSFCYLVLFLYIVVRGFYVLSKWGYVFILLIKYLIAAVLCSGKCKSHYVLRGSRFSVNVEGECVIDGYV